MKRRGNSSLPSSHPIDQDKGSQGKDYDKDDVIKSQKARGRGAGDLGVAVLWVIVLLVLPLSLHNSLPGIPAIEPPRHQFSEARARPHVRAISHDIGVRVVGTLQEKLAGDYILQQLSRIQEESLQSGSEMRLEFSIQNPTGSHLFDFVGKKPVKMYTNITNIVARVYCGPECAEDSAILINTHFDTTLGSPGAVDTAAPIAIMLEMIRNLLSRPRTRHSAIFLFNGAEESLQDASHGFVMGHELTRL